ncbi:serine protease [Luteimonas sp. SX5]|uniref:Serine protease n=1 Tax=Luteimonas galliterrae TaxID=2940486 RepID=A0ABT0MHC4_9GAMM|nr:serine protease [Luteimonas galliterrae]MCL1634269.1 serine protease [Luteimonas galliterrae]
MNHRAYRMPAWLSAGTPLTGISLALMLSLPPTATQAQNAPKAQRISTGEVKQRMRAQPQGATVPAQITKQGNSMVLQTADSAVKVNNADYLGQQVRQMPVQATVTEGPGDSVEIKAVELQATKRWNDRSPAWRARYGNVDAAQKKLSGIAEKALSAEATDSDLKQLKQSVEDTEQQVIKAYRALPESQRQEQRALVEQHAELRRLNKSLYGIDRDDRYPPQAYERIYANSRGAFALRVKGQDKPRCSAVLIGEKLALTNNHCILEEAPEELEAVFDYEDDLSGQHMTSKVFPLSNIRLTDEDERGKLDFVLLELGANADGALPGRVYPVQCLSLKPVKRDDPLYVVGFPLGEPRTVHDNAFVYFPFRVTPDEYAEIKMLVSAEFDSIEAEEQSYREGKLKEFVDSYQLRENGGQPYYEYISMRFDQQPTIGADSDTYHGNSGSPVYNRRTHAVIGLLFDGQEDLSEPWAAGWRAHEAVLPITQVVERLDNAAPAWREDPRVCVQSN